MKMNRQKLAKLKNMIIFIGLAFILIIGLKLIDDQPQKFTTQERIERSQKKIQDTKNIKIKEDRLKSYQDLTYQEKLLYEQGLIEL